MAIELLPDFVRTNYEVHEWKHATAILYNDFPIEWQDIIDVLTSFRLRRSQVESPGGRKSLVADALDGAFFAHGWVEKSFQTEVMVDKRVMNSPTHEVDCY